MEASLEEAPALLEREMRLIELDVEAGSPDASRVVSVCLVLGAREAKERRFRILECPAPR